MFDGHNRFVFAVTDYLFDLFENLVVLCVIKTFRTPVMSTTTAFLSPPSITSKVREVLSRGGFVSESVPSSVCPERVEPGRADGLSETKRPVGISRSTPE